MFAKFNLQLGDNQISDNYREYGLRQKQISDEKSRQSIDKYLLKDGSLSATAIEKDWFLGVDARFFLSHSHADETAVINLAGFLSKELGITSFIDSTVWGYADNLLKQIDEKYCLKAHDVNGNSTYSYEKRNRTTAQVHLLLQGALAKMIDRCECLIFVNSPKSLKVSNIEEETSTGSPWIYSEILMASTFPIRPLAEYRTDELLHFDAKITYDVNLTGFVDLSIQDLIKAKNDTVIKTPSKILERLYQDKAILKV